MSVELVPVAAERSLTAARFQGLADVPSELEWFANIDTRAPAGLTRTLCRTSCGSPGSSNRVSFDRYSLSCHRLAR